MTHWALQYSDRVEVLEPQELRNEIVEKVKVLSEKNTTKNYKNRKKICNGKKGGKNRPIERYNRKCKQHIDK